MNLAIRMVSAACALGAVAGCSVSIEPIGVSGPPTIELPAGEGELTVNWLVAGSTSPAMCARFGADRLELVVYDETGQPVTRVMPPCESFSVSLALQEGVYTADATLLTPSGSPLSTTSTMHALEITAGTGLTVNLDFPRDSLR